MADGTGLARERLEGGMCYEARGRRERCGLVASISR